MRTTQKKIANDWIFLFRLVDIFIRSASKWENLRINNGRAQQFLNTHLSSANYSSIRTALEEICGAKGAHTAIGTVDLTSKWSPAALNLMGPESARALWVAQDPSLPRSRRFLSVFYVWAPRKLFLHSCRVVVSSFSFHIFPEPLFVGLALLKAGNEWGSLLELGRFLL